jgi:RHS repeat-associated protein
MMDAEADGPGERERRLHQAVAACLEAAAAGAPLTPDQRRLCYPEFAAELAEFFSGRDLVERLAAPLRDVAARPAPAVLAEGPPPRLGEYRLLREVGRGGMGVVYEAVQESLGRHVALKVLPAHALLAPEHLERFRREARAAALLHHSNIVPVFGTGEDRGVCFYAMQFIHGQSPDRVLRELRQARGQADDLSASLAEGLRTGQFPAGAAASPVAPTCSGEAGADTPRSGLPGSREGGYFRGVARIGVQAAEALAYAHKQGIVHRDVKPSNLLLDAQGTVWVTDFGLAKAEGTGELTRSGDVVGTLRYLAPERFAGRSDPRGDVYSLGATLYELLTLRPAFDERDRARLIERVTHGEPPRPRQVDGRIPRDLETVVLKALAQEPAERYPTAEALADDLRRFLLDIDYVVDGEGNRVGKKVNGTLTQGFLYDAGGRVTAELDGAGHVVSQFVYGSNGVTPDYLIKGGVEYRILADERGSVRLVVNAATGQVVQQLSYDAFGNVTQDSNPAFQPFGFAGGLYDRDTGLVLLGARSYDPRTGRWTSPDPLGFGGGQANLYAYVGNDPVNAADPSGLGLLDDIGSGLNSAYHTAGDYYDTARDYVVSHAPGFIASKAESYVQIGPIHISPSKKELSVGTSADISVGETKVASVSAEAAVGLTENQSADPYVNIQRPLFTARLKLQLKTLLSKIPYFGPKYFTASWEGQTEFGNAQNLQVVQNLLSNVRAANNVIDPSTGEIGELPR